MLVDWVLLTRHCDTLLIANWISHLLYLRLSSDFVVLIIYTALRNIHTVCVLPTNQKYSHKYTAQITITNL